eukprot:CFRG2390T1
MSRPTSLTDSQAIQTSVHVKRKSDCTATLIITGTTNVSTSSLSGLSAMSALTSEECSGDVDHRSDSISSQSSFSLSDGEMREDIRETTLPHIRDLGLDFSDEEIDTPVNESAHDDDSPIVKNKTTNVLSGVLTDTDGDDDDDSDFFGDMEEEDVPFVRVALPTNTVDTLGAALNSARLSSGDWSDSDDDSWANELNTSSPEAKPRNRLFSGFKDGLCVGSDSDCMDTSDSDSASSREDKFKQSNKNDITTSLADDWVMPSTHVYPLPKVNNYTRRRLFAKDDCNDNELGDMISQGHLTGMTRLLSRRRKRKSAEKPSSLPSSDLEYSKETLTKHVDLAYEYLCTGQRKKCHECIELFFQKLTPKFVEQVKKAQDLPIASQNITSAYRNTDVYMTSAHVSEKLNASHTYKKEGINESKVYVDEYVDVNVNVNRMLHLAVLLLRGTHTKTKHNGTTTKGRSTRPVKCVECSTLSKYADIVAQALPHHSALVRLLQLEVHLDAHYVEAECMHILKALSTSYDVLVGKVTTLDKTSGTHNICTNTNDTSTLSRSSNMVESVMKLASLGRDEEIDEDIEMLCKRTTRGGEKRGTVVEATDTNRGANLDEGGYVREGAHKDIDIDRGSSASVAGDKMGMGRSPMRSLIVLFTHSVSVLEGDCQDEERMLSGPTVFQDDSNNSIHKPMQVLKNVHTYSGHSESNSVSSTPGRTHLQSDHQPQHARLNDILQPRKPTSLFYKKKALLSTKYDMNCTPTTIITAAHRDLRVLILSDVYMLLQGLSPLTGEAASASLQLPNFRPVSNRFSTITSTASRHGINVSCERLLQDLDRTMVVLLEPLCRSRASTVEESTDVDEHVDVSESIELEVISMDISRSESGTVRQPVNACISQSSHPTTHSVNTSTSAMHTPTTIPPSVICLGKASYCLGLYYFNQRGTLDVARKWLQISLNSFYPHSHTRMSLNQHMSPTQTTNARTCSGTKLYNSRPREAKQTVSKDIVTGSTKNSSRNSDHGANSINSYIQDVDCVDVKTNITSKLGAKVDETLIYKSDQQYKLETPVTVGSLVAVPYPELGYTALKAHGETLVAMEDHVSALEVMSMGRGVHAALYSNAGDVGLMRNLASLYSNQADECTASTRLRSAFVDKATKCYTMVLNQCIDSQQTNETAQCVHELSRLLTRNNRHECAIRCLSEGLRAVDDLQRKEHKRQKTAHTVIRIPILTVATPASFGSAQNAGGSNSNFSEKCQGSKRRHSVSGYSNVGTENEKGRIFCTEQIIGRDVGAEYVWAWLSVSVTAIAVKLCVELAEVMMANGSFEAAAITLETLLNDPNQYNNTNINPGLTSTCTHGTKHTHTSMCSHIHQPTPNHNSADATSISQNATALNFLSPTSRAKVRYTLAVCLIRKRWLREAIAILLSESATYSTYRTNTSSKSDNENGKPSLRGAQPQRWRRSQTLLVKAYMIGNEWEKAVGVCDELLEVFRETHGTNAVRTKALRWKGVALHKWAKVGELSHDRGEMNAADRSYNMSTNTSTQFRKHAQANLHTYGGKYCGTTVTSMLDMANECLRSSRNLSLAAGDEVRASKCLCHISHVQVDRYFIPSVIHGLSCTTQSGNLKSDLQQLKHDAENALEQLVQTTAHPLYVLSAQLTLSEYWLVHAKIIVQVNDSHGDDGNIKKNAHLVARERAFMYWSKSRDLLVSMLVAENGLVDWDNRCDPKIAQKILVLMERIVRLLMMFEPCTITENELLLDVLLQTQMLCTTASHQVHFPIYINNEILRSPSSSSSRVSEVGWREQFMVRTDAHVVKDGTKHLYSQSDASVQAHSKPNREVHKNVQQPSHNKPSTPQTFTTHISTFVNQRYSGIRDGDSDECVSSAWMAISRLSTQTRRDSTKSGISSVYGVLGRNNTVNEVESVESNENEIAVCEHNRMMVSQAIKQTASQQRRVSSHQKEDANSINRLSRSFPGESSAHTSPLLPTLTHVRSCHSSRNSKDSLSNASVKLSSVTNTPRWPRTLYIIPIDDNIYTYSCKVKASPLIKRMGTRPFRTHIVQKEIGEEPGHKDESLVWPSDPNHSTVMASSRDDTKPIGRKQEILCTNERCGMQSIMPREIIGYIRNTLSATSCCYAIPSKEESTRGNLEEGSSYTRSLRCYGCCAGCSASRGATGEGAQNSTIVTECDRNKYHRGNSTNNPETTAKPNTSTTSRTLNKSLSTRRTYSPIKSSSLCHPDNYATSSRQFTSTKHSKVECTSTCMNGHVSSGGNAEEDLIGKLRETYADVVTMSRLSRLYTPVLPYNNPCKANHTEAPPEIALVSTTKPSTMSRGDDLLLNSERKREPGKLPTMTQTNNACEDMHLGTSGLSSCTPTRNNSIPNLYEDIKITSCAWSDGMHSSSGSGDCLDNSTDGESERGRILHRILGSIFNTKKSASYGSSSLSNSPSSASIATSKYIPTRPRCARTSFTSCTSTSTDGGFLSSNADVSTTSMNKSAFGSFGDQTNNPVLVLVTTPHLHALPWEQILGEDACVRLLTVVNSTAEINVGGMNYACYGDCTPTSTRMECCCKPSESRLKADAATVSKAAVSKGKGRIITFYSSSNEESTVELQHRLHYAASTVVYSLTNAAFSDHVDKGSLENNSLSVDMQPWWYCRQNDRITAVSEPYQSLVRAGKKVSRYRRVYSKDVKFVDTGGGVGESKTTLCRAISSVTLQGRLNILVLTMSDMTNATNGLHCFTNSITSQHNDPCTRLVAVVVPVRHVKETVRTLLKFKHTKRGPSFEAHVYSTIAKLRKKLQAPIAIFGLPPTLSQS